MLGRLFAVILALSLTLLCSAKVSAQEILTLPAGGLHRVGAEACKALGSFEAAAVTLAPKAGDAVLYLDGQPLELYRLLTAEELERVQIFSSKRLSSVTIGVTPFPQGSGTRGLRIRCINPDYQGQT